VSDVLESLEALNSAHNAVIRFFEVDGQRRIRVAIEDEHEKPVVVVREVKCCVRCAVTLAVSDAVAEGRRSTLKAV
jgi:hypothetical protein